MGIDKSIELLRKQIIDANKRKLQAFVSVIDQLALLGGEWANLPALIKEKGIPTAIYASSLMYSSCYELFSHFTDVRLNRMLGYKKIFIFDWKPKTSFFEDAGQLYKKEDGNIIRADMLTVHSFPNKI